MTTYHIIGDVHGQLGMLQQLLARLGYSQPDPARDPWCWVPPAGCQLISVGDLVDRGPDNLACLRTLARMMETGAARMVMGNHEWRLRRLLRHALDVDGERRGRVATGRLMTWVEVLGQTPDEQRRLLEVIDALPAFLSLDDGRLIVTHAAWDRRWRRLGREAQLRGCAFGDDAPGSMSVPVGASGARPPIDRRGPLVTLPETARLPARARWTRLHPGPELVVWGHQIVTPGAVTRVGSTINVESGAQDGRLLSAFVYPTGEVVQSSPGTPWKVRFRQWRSLEGALFPTSLDEVARAVVGEELGTAADYLEWLNLLAEDADVPPPDASLVRTHRALYARARDLMTREVGWRRRHCARS